MTENRTAPQPHTHHLRVQRTARYFTLGGTPGAEPKSIWFVLHGYGQLAAVFIRYFSDLASDDTLIVAPEAMNRFYLVGIDKAPARDRPVGATWMTREDRDCEIADYVEYLDALQAEVAPSAKINVIGFSQGAATATRWVEHGAATVERLVLWGGLMPPETDLKRGHAGLRHVPLTYVIGTRDQYVTADMVAAEIARLDAAGIPHEMIRFNGGHVISRTAFPRITASAISGASGR